MDSKGNIKIRVQKAVMASKVSLDYEGKTHSDTSS